MSETGSVKLGMMVAVKLRRNTKMTAMTRASAISSVSLTSWTDSRIDSERSILTSSETPGGSWARTEGSSFLISSTTWTTFDPGCFWIIRLMFRVPWYQLAVLSCSTPSYTRATSPSRTGLLFL